MKTVILAESDFGTEIILKNLKSFSRLDTVSFSDKELCINYVEENDVFMLFVYADERSGKLIDFIEKEKSFLKMGVFIFGEDGIVNEYSDFCDKILTGPLTENDIAVCKEISSAVRRRFTAKPKAVTFGNFDLFLDNQSVCFHNKKAKELFALCVDRMGGAVTMNEAIYTIWQCESDEKTKRRYRTAVQDIRSALEEYGALSVFSSSRGECRINRNMIECDLFDFVENPQRNVRKFFGEYMRSYTWAEKTLCDLEKTAAMYRRNNFCK